MNDTSATGKYYTLGHLSLFTGLTDRTLRNYLSSGILEGEKINGVWHFTPEQAQALITHPAVRPQIIAKKNALIYDFLLENKRKEQACCIILDLPGLPEKQTMEYFCHAINEGSFQNLEFSFDSVRQTPRIILRGKTEQVLSLVNGYYALQNA
ncbi:MAG: hypothetical protein E7320_05895 [Clostridiales bacterium]|nr:hypothetical protein [Clostridiales bacterium]